MMDTCAPIPPLVTNTRNKPAVSYATIVPERLISPKPVYQCLSLILNNPNSHPLRSKTSACPSTLKTRCKIKHAPIGPTNPIHARPTSHLTANSNLLDPDRIEEVKSVEKPRGELAWLAFCSMLRAAFCGLRIPSCTTRGQLHRNSAIKVVVEEEEEKEVVSTRSEDEKGAEEREWKKGRGKDGSRDGSGTRRGHGGGEQGGRSGEARRTKEKERARISVLEWRKERGGTWGRREKRRHDDRAINNIGEKGDRLQHSAQMLNRYQFNADQ
ncbi:hypothetical protein WN48_04150 [Eufriesea mexicana]|uniref:Uncharacterized protein n=1 Tax=Eufriesea mexicana TaxID=516756 RepID=A0A310SIK1_9HYME|nr:hypothetical protein WN48_04150 [Eufriesea mexicana]